MSFDSAPINLTHHFLIAMPGLEDESFARSVVYLCEHSERGALGLIINKPTDITLQGLFDKVDLSLRREDLSREPVFQGGPVRTERWTGLVKAMSRELTGVPSPQRRSRNSTSTSMPFLPSGRSITRALPFCRVGNSVHTRQTSFQSAFQAVIGRAVMFAIRDFASIELISGFQVPGIFEISAMGAAEADLHLVVPMVLEALGLTIYRDRLRVKPSAKGNYVSVTLVFEAHSREDYDAAHGALREHPAVKWTL